MTDLTDRPAWLDAPLPRQLPPPPNGFTPTVADWLAEAERALARVCADLGIGDTQEFATRVLVGHDKDVTPWDAYAFLDSMKFTGTDEAELLAEAALRFWWVAKQRSGLLDKMGAMNHIAMAFYCIGRASPAAADLVRRRERASRGWEELLEAARNIIKEHGKPGRWRSITEAMKTMAKDIHLAADGIKADEISPKKLAKDPVALVASWCGKGGPLEKQIKKFIVTRRPVAPKGLRPRVRRHLSPFAPDGGDDLGPRAKQPLPKRTP
jgi:hypothetical protein